MKPAAPALLGNTELFVGTFSSAGEFMIWFKGMIAYYLTLYTAVADTTSLSREGINGVLANGEEWESEDGEKKAAVGRWKRCQEGVKLYVSSMQLGQSQSLTICFYFRLRFTPTT